MPVSVCVCAHLVTPNSLQPHGLQPVQLLCPWNFRGKNTGVGRHSLLLGQEDPGIEPASLVSLALARRFFTTSTTLLPALHLAWYKVNYTFRFFSLYNYLVSELIICKIAKHLKFSSVF